MGKLGLDRRVEIEREAVLFRGQNHKDDAGRFICAVNTDIGPSFRNADIAIAAQDAGYKIGDVFRYKIIIEPKQ